MKKIWVLGLAAALLAGCAGRKAQVTEEVAAVEVKTAVAVSEMVAQQVEFTANIEPWKKVYIAPALQGARIDRILVDVGDRVSKGQLVARMDPTQYNTAKAQFDLAEADFKRTKSVFDAGGVSAQMLQQAEAQYLVAKETFDNVARHVNLYSPIDGVVTARGEDEGNLFSQTPILEIMQIDRLKVEVNVSEQYFTSVKVGTPVEVKVDILPGESFEAKVSLVHPAIDPATRTFGAEITIPNGGAKLRPGMFARSVIHMGEREGVMVPDIAVQKQIGSNQRFVYVISNGVADRRMVETGRTIDGRVDVTSGLSAGERVATTSFSRLNDGISVAVTE